MSRQEVTDEMKDSEGDPHLKQQRRQKAVGIAMNRMLEEVPTASVVIVNPTHYAVALRWNRATGGAPVVVAKGVDEMAARIRERAAAAGVPIRRDPPPPAPSTLRSRSGRRSRAPNGVPSPPRSALRSACASAGGKGEGGSAGRVAPAVGSRCGDEAVLA
jgi:hypothetical protein